MEGVMEENENQENVSGLNDQRSETLNVSPRKQGDETGTM